MTKSTKVSAASINLSNAILDSDISADFVAAQIKKAPKAPKAPKATKEVVAVVEAPKAPRAKQVKAEGEVGLTVRELAIIKAIASSDFIDSVSGAVPSFTLGVAVTIPFGVNKVNSPIPGIVASLQKKGVIETFKVKGQSMIVFSDMGKEFVEGMN